MAPRIRTVKPDIWADEDFGRLPSVLKITFLGLITQADDQGRLCFNPRILRMAIFPYDDDVTDERFEEFIFELSRVGRTADDPGMVRVYESKHRRYLDLPTWRKHQKVNKPTPSTIPEFSPELEASGPFTEDSGSPTGVLREHSLWEGNGMEGNGIGKEGKGARAREAAASPPNVEKLISKASEIQGWSFSTEEDGVFFPRLLEEYPDDLVEKVIEDLRTFQERPTRDYSNLHKTLRNWCGREVRYREECGGNGNQADTGPPLEDRPKDENGKEMLLIDGRWIGEKDFDRLRASREIIRNGDDKRWVFAKGAEVSNGS